MSSTRSHNIAVGIDLGGTNLKTALIDDAGHIIAKADQPTQADRGPETVINDMVTLVDHLLAGAGERFGRRLDRGSIAGVGVGSPGPLSVKRGHIIHAPNLPGWRDLPLRDTLSVRLGVRVVLENDGNAAAFGEHWVRSLRPPNDTEPRPSESGIPENHESPSAAARLDSHRSASLEADLVMLTLGTGVGAGVVLDGRIVHGHFENAAEIGHTIVVPDGLECVCGQRGCLEQYASAANVVRRVVEAVERGEPSTLAYGVRRGEAFPASRVGECAAAGDAVCERIWNDACKYLAVACVNIQHNFNPATIVLGGGMAAAGSNLIDPVRRHFREQTWSVHDDRPAIERSRLGSNAGLVGAAALALRIECGERSS